MDDKQLRSGKSMLNKKVIKGSVTLMLAATLLLAACGNNNGNNPASNATNSTATGNAGQTETAQKQDVKLSGEILIDGSSTVYPITEAVAEEFNALHKDVRVPVGVSGTGGGFKQFCAGDIAIADASRLIKAAEEEACAANGIEFTKLDVAYDGLSVVISKENDFIDYLTVDELHAIYSSTSGTVKWSDIRPEWPAENIVLYSPGADSGTYDYFAEAILGEDPIKTEGVTFSEDDNVLVVGVAGSKYAIGYFGFAYYEENADKLNVVAIDGGNGPVSPSYETINNSSYTPLSRSLFIYINNKEMKERPEVNAFVNFYLENAGELAGEVGYVAMPDELYAEQIALINK